MSTRGPPNLCPGSVNTVSGVACGVGCENSLAANTELKTRFSRVLERGFVIVVGFYGLDHREASRASISHDSHDLASPIAVVGLCLKVETP